MNSKFRAELSDAVAGRTLPAHAHERALQFLDFLDKVGTTPTPTAAQMEPNLMTITDISVSRMPRPSAMIVKDQLLPAVTPFPSR